MTPEGVRASYRRMLNEAGETIRIRRFAGSGSTRPRFDAKVMARVTGYRPEEIAGAVQQGDRKIIALAEDLLDAGIALPITTSDAAVVRGREMKIIAVDDSTRRVKGELIALELVARG